MKLFFVRLTHDDGTTHTSGVVKIQDYTAPQPLLVVKRQIAT